MKISERVRSNLRELSDAEYENLWKDIPPRGYGRRDVDLSRIPDEEYQQMMERSESK